MQGKKPPSPELIEKAKRYRNDFPYFASKCIKIKSHTNSTIVPLVFNKPQQILHAISEKMADEFGFIRIIGLKSRRVGFSTYVEGRFYHKTSTRPNRHAFIVAHEVDSTNTLFQMSKLMQEQNPLRPSVRHSNEKLLRFDTEAGTGLKSEYHLATATNVDAGRSQGVHFLHASEEAFWPNADLLLDGLLRCIPKPPAYHEVYRESTGNGFGNPFQRDTFEIYDSGAHPYYEIEGIVYAWRKPGKDWILCFIPWFADDTCSMPFKSEADKLTFAANVATKVFDPDRMEWVDSESSRLQSRFSLALEQLNWREWEIENNCKAPTRKQREEKFKQEYPSTVEEAFISQGSNIYPKSLCDDLEQLTQSPLLIGELVDRAGETKVRRHEYGKFRLWVKPARGETYFLTVDTGGGLKTSQVRENREPDPTCIDVWRRSDGAQCAQWHGHMDYGLIASTVYMIGRMYGAMNKSAVQLPRACVEAANHGHTVIKDLREMHYQMFEAKPGEPGWLTTGASKPKMVDDLGEMARNGDLKIACRETIAEMRTYVEENGKFNAAQGCHDDRVISAAMASQMMSLLPSAIDTSRDNAGFSNLDGRGRPKADSGRYVEMYA